MNAYLSKKIQDTIGNLHPNGIVHSHVLYRR